MTSCGGTSRTTVRSGIVTMRSSGQKRKMRPGPLGWGRTRPRRKTTPRSYSLSTRTQRRRSEMPKITSTKTIATWGNVFSSTLPHSELQSFDRDHFDGGVGRDRLAAFGRPDLAVDEDASDRHERRDRPAALAHQALRAGRHPRALRPRREQGEEADHHGGEGGCCENQAARQP